MTVHHTPNRFAGRTAIVTGAGSGIGRATALRLAAEGARLVVTDVSAQRLDDLRAEIGTAIVGSIVGDISDQATIDACVAACGGTVHLLANVAGIMDAFLPVAEIDDATWDRVIAVNLTAVMRMCRAVVPVMIAGGGGSIVNVSSPVAILGARKISYAASKAALLGLNAALARALGRDGIRVNAVLPGPTISFMTNDWDEEKRDRIAASTFLGRLCEPWEVAAVLSFLVGPDSTYMTGAVLDLTAGALHGGHS